MKLTIWIIRSTGEYKHGERLELPRDEATKLVRGGYAIYKAPETKKLIDGEIETAMLRTPSKRSKKN